MRSHRRRRVALGPTAHIAPTAVGMSTAYRGLGCPRPNRALLNQGLPAWVRVGAPKVPAFPRAPLGSIGSMARDRSAHRKEKTPEGGEPPRGPVFSFAIGCQARPQRKTQLSSLSMLGIGAMLPCPCRRFNP